MDEFRGYELRICTNNTKITKSIFTSFVSFV